jgi:two-component system chemotaxis response regulator CheY
MLEVQVFALIVDDSKAARELAAGALRQAAAFHKLEIDVEMVETGMQALKILASEDVALLLTDLHLPDVHGMELLRFWTQTPASKAGRALVMSTGLPDTEREKIRQAGAHAFLEKPLTAEALEQGLSGLDASKS